VTHRQAAKIALRDYAKQAGIPIPNGFNTSDTYGSSARELCKRVQRKNRIKQTGDLTPKTILVIGKYLPGQLGERAAWAMRIVEGPLEVWGNNRGPYVEEIQKLGTQLSSGAWPWCAATTSWAYRCAGWKSWAAFCKGMNEAYVPDWVAAAQAKRYGMSIIGWRSSKTGDAITYQFDDDREQDHIGLLIARPNLATGVCRSIEGNTSSGEYGSQSDGSGLWTRTRNAKPPQIMIRIT
jgi:hypothetical protein